MRISGVCERDIDLLLLEEFHASLDFRNWFAQQVLGKRTECRQLVDGRRSVTQSAGESDLEVTILTTEAARVRFLIENKVSAGLQPQQAERYRQRGDTYQSQGECKAYYTVIVAPARYFGSPDTTKGFDKRITYESIRDWFAQAEVLGDRRQYKLTLLTSAIEKGTLGYQPQEDLPVTDFWRTYWLMAKELAPELQMKEPLAKPARAGFVHFRPTSLPKDVAICHKLQKGVVDLQFRDMGNRLHELNLWFEHCLTNEMHITHTMKSGVIRINVPVLDTNVSLPTQTDNVRAGLDAAITLLKWFQKNHIYREHKQERPA